MGHGLTALILGGHFTELKIFSNASGLAYSYAGDGVPSGLVAAGGLLAPPIVGALLIGNCVRRGAKDAKPYNHYSQLRSFEDMFGLSLLGDAKMKQVAPFGSDVFTQPQG